jgi:hypothetical protein
MKLCIILTLQIVLINQQGLVGFVALGDLHTTHTRILYLGKLTSIHINSPLLNSKSYRRDAIYIK